MSDPSTDSPGLELRYEDLLPLRCTTLTAPPDSTRIHHLQERNDEVLRVLAALDEYHPEPADDHAQLTHELQRLDFKLNLLLDLISRLLAAQQPLPPAVALRLAASDLEWVTERPPPAGTWVEIELYLNPRYPAPLALPGQVASLDHTHGGTRVRVTFSALSEPVRDRLEKIIFRQHRRLIAQARRRPGT